MMMTIMTCTDCGADLREWDFLKRRARLVENRPYCTVCKPTVRSSRRGPGRRPVPRPRRPTASPEPAIAVGAGGAQIPRDN